jgi:hypothetical protein
LTENEIPITLSELPPYCGTCKSFHHSQHTCRGTMTTAAAGNRRPRFDTNNPEHMAEIRRAREERERLQNERLANIRDTGILHCTNCGATDWTGYAPAVEHHYGSSPNEPGNNTVAFTFNETHSDEPIDQVYCADCGADAPPELEVTWA